MKKMLMFCLVLSTFFARGQYSVELKVEVLDGSNIIGSDVTTIAFDDPNTVTFDDDGLPFDVRKQRILHPLPPVQLYSYIAVDTSGTQLVQTIPLDGSCVILGLDLDQTSDLRFSIQAVNGTVPNNLKFYIADQTGAASRGEVSTSINYLASRNSGVEIDDFVFMALEESSNLAIRKDNQWINFDAIGSGARTTGLASNIYYDRIVFDAYTSSEVELLSKDFEVRPGVTVTFPAGTSLNMDGTLLNDGTLTFESGSSLLMSSTSVYEGNDAIIKKTTTFDENTGEYSVVGSPIESATFNVLDGAVTNNFIFAYEETNIPVNNSDGVRFVRPSSFNDIMTPGKGYFSAFTGDANGTIVFNGVPNFEDILMPITRTALIPADESFEGQNLIANPYPCGIDFDAFITENTTLLEEDAIKIWDDNANEYLTVNATGSVGTNAAKWNGTINSGQGFFVEAKSNGDIVFNDAMKTIQGNDDASFFRESSKDIPKLYLALTNGGGFHSEMLIGFNDQSTQGFDKAFDATLFRSDLLGITSKLDNKSLIIQTIPELVGDNVVELELSMKTKGSGVYEISITEASNLPVDYNVYLKNRKTGKVADLKESRKAINFSSDIEESYSVLIARNDNLLNTENEVYVYSEDGNINLQSALPHDVSVVNMFGKEIVKAKSDTGVSSLLVPKSGLYIVIVESAQSVSKHKVVVR